MITTIVSDGRSAYFSELSDRAELVLQGASDSARSVCSVALHVNRERCAINSVCGCGDCPFARGPMRKYRGTLNNVSADLMNDLDEEAVNGKR